MNTLKPLKERRFRFGKKPIHIRSSIPIPKRFRRIVNNNRPFPLDPFDSNFKELFPKSRLRKTFQYIPLRQYLFVRREFEFRRNIYSRCSSKYRIRLHKKFLRSRRRFFIPSRNQIHYKNISLISRFIGFQGKIIPRRVTKITLRQQRLMTTAIKKARILCLLPFLENERHFRKRWRQILKRRRENEKKKNNKKRFRKTSPKTKPKFQVPGSVLERGIPRPKTQPGTQLGSKIEPKSFSFGNSHCSKTEKTRKNPF